jgi:hypothetical protein
MNMRPCQFSCLDAERLPFGLLLDFSVEIVGNTFLFCFRACTFFSLSPKLCYNLIHARENFHVNVS